MFGKIVSLSLLILAFVSPCAGQRKPVLPQIDLPHPYYFREMYLPQLTSGPSSVAWSPDSHEVVYSMAGSLWRQKIDSTEAQQLTDGRGYDYQPDWSPDGKSIVYCSYQKDAIELWLLDVASGESQQISTGGAVNVEPRWSPDSKQIVFVSTIFNKRFHIFRADMNSGKLENIVRLTGETKSSLPRYYYSAFDMEISPVWARDGQEILFISNRGHIHGTGGLWRMKAEPGAEAREIHYEETNWKARPDFSPDGSRMVYSSYLGRQWHNLWLMPANGGDAFPISYGDWDETNARWSPDGKHLAFISNRNGNTGLGLLEIPGGEQRELRAETRRFLGSLATVKLKVTDAAGKPTAARVSVTDANGKFHAPHDSWIHADDGFDRGERAFEAHYFHIGEKQPAEIAVPEGKVTIEVMKGFEYTLERRTLEVKEDQAEVNIALRKMEPMSNSAGQWVSADLHVHMNYGGEYRNMPGRLAEQAEAENLRIVNELVVNKEQRFPDMAFNRMQFDEASGPNVQIVRGQEFHTSYWGHLGLLNMRDSILLPGYAGYPNTAAASLFPMNADVYDLAHKKGALVGEVHPFDEFPDPFAIPAQRITNELPVDAALGKIDYMEIVGFSDHRSDAAVWYKLLNLGYRIPAGAGTDAMANFASLRGPVGMNRVYAKVPRGETSVEIWLQSLKTGRTFATNGPLLEFTLGEQGIGGELKFSGPQEAIPFTAKLRSIVPVDHLEIVCNGRVAQGLKLETSRDTADVIGTLPFRESGWCVLRASSDKAEYPVLDNYVYATTSPIYVTVAGKAPRSPEDAKYFVAWIERVIDTTSQYPDWNSPQEKELVMKRLADAKLIFEKMR